MLTERKKKKKTLSELDPLCQIILDPCMRKFCKGGGGKKLRFFCFSQHEEGVRANILGHHQWRFADGPIMV